MNTNLSLLEFISLGVLFSKRSFEGSAQRIPTIYPSNIRLCLLDSSRAKNNQAELYARVTVNQKRANISLQRKIDIDSCDKLKNRVKGNGQKARILNQYIEKVKYQLFHNLPRFEK